MDPGTSFAEGVQEMVKLNRVNERHAEIFFHYLKSVSVLSPVNYKEAVGYIWTHFGRFEMSSIHVPVRRDLTMQIPTPLHRIMCVNYCLKAGYCLPLIP